MDLALNNLQGLMCHKTQQIKSNQIKSNPLKYTAQLVGTVEYTIRIPPNEYPGYDIKQSDGESLQ